VHKESVIRLEGVSTTYEGERRPAIKGVSLTVSENELVYVVGPNASGKTTLLETINGLLQPSQGHVLLFGLDMGKHGRDIRCEIGYVPQDFMVDPGEPYTAMDIVMMRAHKEKEKVEPQDPSSNPQSHIFHHKT
jgi:ABC-type Mn2+/Zn2+ transport system ATPase subunit